MNLPENWNPADLDDVHAQLGEPEASFGPDPIRLIAGIIVCASAAIFGVCFVCYPTILGFQDEWIRFGFGPFLLFISLGGIFWISLLTHTRVLVYEQAIIIRRRRLVTVVRWESISRFSQIGVKNQTIQITLGDGTSLKFDADTIKHTVKLMVLLCTQALRRGIPYHLHGANLAQTQLLGRIREVPRSAIQSIVDLTKFGEQVGRILNAAERIAHTYRHDYLGTEHVLLALLYEAPNEASAAVDRCGVPLEAVIRQMTANIETSPRASRRLRSLPQTPRLIACFQFVDDECNRMSGTCALLLGLIREADGIAGLALAKAGVKESAVREQIQKRPGL